MDDDVKQEDISCTAAANKSQKAIAGVELPDQSEGIKLVQQRWKGLRL